MCCVIINKWQHIEVFFIFAATIQATIKDSNMKTQTAVIKAVQLTRANAEGNYPIAIRINYKGRVMKSLPIAVPQKQWDKDRECVRKSYPNAAMLNKIIEDEKQKIIQIKLEYETKGEEYTAKDLIIEKKLDNEKISNDIDTIYNRLKEERKLKPNSAKTYTTIIKMLKEYYCKSKDDTLKIDTINGDNIQGFCKWLTEDKKCSDATVSSSCKRLAALHRYAQELGVVSEKTFPFKKFKYWKVYKYGGTKKALTQEQMLNIESYWANKFFTYDAEGNIYYKDNNYTKRIYVKSSEEYALVMFLSCFYLQGLAMTDMAEIKVSQIKLKHSTKKVVTNHETEIEYNGTIRKAIVPIEEEVDYDYYTIEDVQRKKTRQEVPIVVEITPAINAMFNHYITTSKDRDGFLFPIYEKDGLTDDEKMHILQSTYTCVNGTLKTIFKNVNDIAHKYRKDNGIDDDWEDITNDTTFYTARHTFASIMASNGVSNADLAKMMGRTISNIENYIHSIRTTEDLIKLKTSIK